MAYFNPDFLAFFKELTTNNTKEWFDANRARYEKEVKKPFNTFVSDLIIALRQDVADLALEPKDCIFRINRDIRFSADKTPYKTQMSALVSPGGRKAMSSLTGLYLELSPEHVGIYGGLYMPDKEQLADVRQHIRYNPEAFKKAYTNADFVRTYGTIRGEQNKRLDADLAEAAQTEPLIYNKQFYYQSSLPADAIFAEDLIPTILRHYSDAAAVRNFLIDATS